MSKWSADPSPLLMRHHRILAEMTIMQASDVSKLSHTTICDAESGKTKPTAKTQTKLAKAYCCDVSDFYEVDIATVKSLANQCYCRIFSTIRKANIDRKAAIATDLLVRLPDAHDTGPENIAEQYPDLLAIH